MPMICVSWKEREDLFKWCYTIERILKVKEIFIRMMLNSPKDPLRKGTGDAKRLEQRHKSSKLILEQISVALVIFQITEVFHYSSLLLCYVQCLFEETILEN